jgi:NADPH2:quinone reductase
MTRSASAIVLAGYGGVDQLSLQQVEVAEPGAGEILLRHTAVGVNFHDCYVRTGLYRTLTPPGIPGLEGVGVVEAVGAEVDGLRVGDRVAWISPKYGGYASHRVLAADLAVKIPDELADGEVAASLMRVMTVAMLTRISHTLTASQTALIHAAAGGMGQLLTQWASHAGATVIATVGSPEKAEIAKRAGAHHVILYREEDFVERTLSLTAGVGVDVAYDSVGADTFEGSLKCLDFGGAAVSYGQSSGPAPPIALADLAAKSLTVTRPILFHFLRTRRQLEDLTASAFDALRRGVVRPLKPLELPLRDAAQAHRLIESRQSPGGIVLVP